MRSVLFSKIQGKKSRIHGSQKSREGPRPKPDPEKNEGNLPEEAAADRELRDHFHGKDCGAKRGLRPTVGRIRKLSGTEQNRNGICQLGSIILIRFYQRVISPGLPRMCRFYPSCSEYSAQAIDQYGFWKGSFKSISRIIKCHPFHPGGYDPLT